jgi:hypothetical protein
VKESKKPRGDVAVADKWVDRLVGPNWRFPLEVNYWMLADDIVQETVVRYDCDGDRIYGY